MIAQDSENKIILRVCKIPQLLSQDYLTLPSKHKLIIDNMKKQWVSILLTAITFAMGVATAGSAQMAFIGALIGAAASIAGSVANGVMSSKANSKAEAKEREREQMKRRYLEQQLKEENEDYAANINERAMYRYTAQYNANKLSDALREQLKNSRNRQAVMGGTDEQIAAQMESNANAMSDYYGQVEMAEEERKKQLEQEHKQRKRELNAAAADVTDQALAHQADYQRAKGQNIANAVGQGISSLGSIAAGLDTQSIKRGNTNQGEWTVPDVSDKIELGAKPIKIDYQTTPAEKLFPTNRMSRAEGDEFLRAYNENYNRLFGKNHS